MERLSIWAMVLVLAAFGLVLVLGPTAPERTPGGTQAQPQAATTQPGTTTKQPSASVLTVPASDSSSATATRRQALTAVAACRDVAAIPGQPADRCRTRTALLTIGLLEDTVRLGEGTQASALRVSSRSAGEGKRTIEVVVQVRNATRQPRTLAPDQLYLYARGRRLAPDIIKTTSGSRTIGGRARVRVTARYTLDRDFVQRVQRADGLADLGIRPFSTPAGQPRRVGVVRLQLDL